MIRNVIAILRGVQPDQVEAIGEVILAEGISMLEVPLNSPNPLQSISKLTAAFGADAKIGAGTVLSHDDVTAVADVGGKIIVSPNCNPVVIEATKSNGMESYPGVATPSECFTALRHGADGLKLFPASLLGIDGYKAISTVLPPGADCFAVGGVNTENFAEWLGAGVAGFGIGTAIYTAGDSAEAVRAKTRAIVQVFDRALEE